MSHKIGRRAALFLSFWAFSFVSTPLFTVHCVSAAESTPLPSWPAPLSSSAASSATSPAAHPSAVPAMVPLSSSPWEVDHVDGSNLVFKPSIHTPSPPPLKTTLQELKFLGSLKASEGTDGPGASPFLLVTGRPCADCMEDKAVYLIRADGGKPNQFIFPGKILDPKTHGVLYESRAFYGKCLSSEPGEIYVVFQKDWVDRQHHHRKSHSIESSVLVVEPGHDHFHEHLIERRPPKIASLLPRIKAKICHEIEGRARNALNKPLDLHPRHGDLDDKDEDSDADSDTEKETTH